MALIIICIVVCVFLYYMRGVFLNTIIIAGIIYFVITKNSDEKDQTSQIDQPVLTKEEIREQLANIEIAKINCGEYAETARSIERDRQEDLDIEETRKKFYNKNYKYVKKEDIDEILKISYSYKIMSGDYGKTVAMPDASWEEGYKRCGKRFGLNFKIE